MNSLFTLFGKPVDDEAVPDLIAKYGLPLTEFMPGGIVRIEPPRIYARLSCVCQGCGAPVTQRICEYCRRPN